MFVAPWILGTVLLVAGLAKIRGRQQFTLAIGALVQSATVRQAIGWALPLLEVCAGAMLLIVPLRGPGSVLAILLCLLFVLVALDTILSARPLDCNCFGPFSRGSLGKSGLVRNILLLGLAMATLIREYDISFVELAVVLLAITAVVSILVISYRFLVQRHVDGAYVGDFPILIDPDEYVGTTISTKIIEHLDLDIRSTLDNSASFSRFDLSDQNAGSICYVLIIGNDGCGDCKVLEESLRQIPKVRGLDVVFVKSLVSVDDQGAKSDFIDSWYRVVFSNDLFATVLPCALFIATSGRVHFVEEGSATIIKRLVEFQSSSTQHERSYAHVDTSVASH